MTHIAQEIQGNSKNTSVQSTPTHKSTLRPLSKQVIKRSSVYPQDAAPILSIYPQVTPLIFVELTNSTLYYHNLV
jgi:hypothetical protein